MAAAGAEEVGRNRATGFSENNIFSQNRVKEMSNSLGYVLVFDMDQTITGNYFNVETNKGREIDVNPKIVELLKKAVKAREKGVVSAILLLTNNSDNAFVYEMIGNVNELVFGASLKPTDFVFNEGLTASSPLRNVPPGYPPNHAMKSFRDVKGMMEFINKPSNSLEGRTFFFDDQVGHVLTAQLIQAGHEDHFIHITPPYKKGVVDNTNWNSINAILDSALDPNGSEGGGRRKNKTRSYKKNTKKSRRRQNKNKKY